MDFTRKIAPRIPEVTELVQTPYAPEDQCETLGLSYDFLDGVRSHLDIGCGVHAFLVRELRDYGINSFGIDNNDSDFEYVQQLELNGKDVRIPDGRSHDLITAHVVNSFYESSDLYRSICELGSALASDFITMGDYEGAREKAISIARDAISRLNPGGQFRVFYGIEHIADEITTDQSDVSHRKIILEREPVFDFMKEEYYTSVFTKRT